MLRALWLASWYPDKVDAYNGDFVQRHAYAASLYCKVDVIHVQPDFERVMDDKELETRQVNENLTETIAYLRMSRHPLAKPFNQLKYTRFYKKLLHEYINKQGKPDIVHVHVPIKAGQLALYLKKKFQLPFVVTEHWAIYNDHAPGKFSEHSAWFRWLTKQVINEAAAFFPVSHELGDSVNKLVVKKNYKVVPNVVDTGLFYPVQRQQRESFVFLHASTLNYQKNPEAIIETFIKLHGRYPNTKLRMLGEVPVPLGKFVKKKALPQAVEFYGMVSYRDVARHMQESDCFVLFSRYENLPCVILESFSCGIPVITTAVGGIPEVVHTGNGIIVENDTNSLYSAMEQMVLQNQFYDREAIAHDAASKYSYEVVGKRLLYEYTVALMRDKV